MGPQPDARSLLAPMGPQPHMRMHRPVGSRSLMPREHGAYAQLGLPLTAVLIGGHATVAALSFAVAACAAFVAHEPLLVVLGQRGGRARRDDGARSGRRLAGLGVVAVLSGCAGLALAQNALPMVGIAAAIAAVAGIFVFWGRERSLAGELGASAALTAAALPVAAASGLDAGRAFAVSAVFYATAIVSTVEVRAVARREESATARLSAWAVCSFLVCALAVEAPRFALTVIPPLLVIVGTAVMRPRPARLRQLGWSLAAASLVSTAMIVLALRLR